MGITFESIERMDRLGLFGKGRTSILDIGSDLTGFFCARLNVVFFNLEEGV